MSDGRNSPEVQEKVVNQPKTPAKDEVKKPQKSNNTDDKNKEEDKETIDINDKDVDYALRAVPTFVQDFMKVNGMLNDDHEWMNTRKLKEFLSKASFSKEQAETLKTYLKDKTERKKEFDAYMKDPSKKSMKESYLAKKRAEQELPQKIEDDKKKIADLEQKNIELQQKNKDLEQKNKEQEREIAERKAKAPLRASRGKVEVTKDNGKTKDKNAIILKDEDGKEYFITKKMVKEARKNDSTMLSWGDLKDTVKDGEVSREIFNKLFDKDGKAKYGGYKEIKAKSVDSKAPEDKLTSKFEEIQTPAPTAKRFNRVEAKFDTNVNLAQIMMKQNGGNSI